MLEDDYFRKLEFFFKLCLTSWPNLIVLSSFFSVQIFRVENDCQTPDLGQGLEFDFTFAMEQQ